MKPKSIKLNRGEKIIAVVPERCAGPGWSNAPTWVYIVNRANNQLRTECIQPEERSPELNTLFNVGAAVVSSLLSAIPLSVRKRNENY